MKDVAQLLTDNGIRKAAVIDDAFDEAPQVDDLEVDSWNTFWDDIGTYEGSIREIYPGYVDSAREDLQDENGFISSLWKHRAVLPEEAWATLFEDYEQKNSSEREYLNNLAASLKQLGLECTTLGREFASGAHDAELVFIDLFLGFRQSQSAMEQAITGIRTLVRGRESSPPLVILMSRSRKLAERRNEFRDKAGLLGSTFRIISKADLAMDGTLEVMLTRLAGHYEDAKRVAGFVHAWDNGLDQVRESFVQVLRCLDLSDLAQMRALLLDFEGQNLGEYLLDVADRVLQYEIEGDEHTIAAALELNKIDLSKYPAQHLLGSPDLQALVHRMVFLHSDRLRLSEEGDKVQLQFGDVLRWKQEDTEANSDNVSLILTPACDLVRDGVKHIMLLSGKLESLQPRNWSYKAGPVRTAIVILPDEGRKWIRWNLKDVKALSWSELDALLDQQQRLSRIGRLREIYTIEIQQRLLADFGRVGRPADLPVPFPVDVSFFYVDRDSGAQKLNIEEIASAACYVGRDVDSKPVHRLVLTEQTCDQLERSLLTLNEDNLRPLARASLAAIKADRGLFTRFEHGDIEMPCGTGEKTIRGKDNKVYAVIIRGGDLAEGVQVSGDQKKAALLVKVLDTPEGDAT